MNYLNNFYFKMLVKSAKMTNNMNNDKIFKDVISYFKDTTPIILPHVWLSNGQGATWYERYKWNEVYCKLIQERFIKDTIALIKKVKNVDVKEEFVKNAFTQHQIFNRIFRPNGLFSDCYNKFYYR